MIEDYRVFLNTKYHDRCEKNPNYSLRSFARDLEMNPSCLCNVLKGKQGLSPKSAQKIAENLKLSSTEKKLFCNLAEAQHARNPLKRKLATIRAEHSQIWEEYKIRDDIFKVIADWYHFAIVELLYLKDFEYSIPWMARKLNIFEHEASEAIQRMLSLGLIKEKDGKLIASETGTTTIDGVPSVTLRNFHRQVLKKAVDAINSLPVDERYVSAMTFAANKQELKAMSDYIIEFRRNFASRFCNDQPSKDAVFCLSLQLFPFTTSETDREKT